MRKDTRTDSAENSKRSDVGDVHERNVWVPVAEALRDLLELGYEPQAVADRLGPMIDAIAGELRQLPMNGVVPEAKAALFLGMSIMALRERRYRNTGPIPHFRGRNRKCYYTVSELMRWKEENCCCLECQQLPQ